MSRVKSNLGREFVEQQSVSRKFRSEIIDGNGQCVAPLSRHSVTHRTLLVRGTTRLFLCELIDREGCRDGGSEEWEL